MAAEVAYHEVVTTPRWLSPDEMAAWRGYIETVVPLAAAFESDLADHGLTLGDYELLAWLSEAEEQSMRLSVLAARLRLSPSGMTRRLDGLEHEGAVRREQSSDDRRVTSAVLTEHGLEMLKRAVPDHVSSVREHFIDLLSETEIRTLGAVFEKVRSHLQRPEE